MDHVKAVSLLGGVAIVLAIGYFASIQVGKPGGPEIDGPSDSSFKQTVLTSDMPVLVDFYADWCGPCKAMSPVLDEFAGKNRNIRVVRVNIDKDKDIARYYGVSSIPTFIVFKNGKATARRTGGMDGNELKELVGK